MGKKSVPTVPNTTQYQAKIQPTVPVGQALLSLSPNPLTLTTQTGSLDVVLDTATQKATAVQIELSYDPKVLSNVTITPGTVFAHPVVLLKEINQETGRISFAVGISPTDTEITGKAVVATITFAAVAPATKSTQISFLPKTLVTQQGVRTSILKSSVGSTILFQTAASPTAPTQ